MLEDASHIPQEVVTKVSYWRPLFPGKSLDGVLRLMPQNHINFLFAKFLPQFGTKGEPLGDPSPALLMHSTASTEYAADAEKAGSIKVTNDKT